MCMMCGEEKSDAPGGIETDADGDLWNYCRSCDVWTSHPPERVVDGLSGKGVRVLHTLRLCVPRAGGEGSGNSGPLSVKLFSYSGLRRWTRLLL